MWGVRGRPLRSPEKKLYTSRAFAGAGLRPGPALGARHSPGADGAQPAGRVVALPPAAPGERAGDGGDCRVGLGHDLHLDAHGYDTSDGFIVPDQPHDNIDSGSDNGDAVYMTGTGKSEQKTVENEQDWK